MAGAGPAGNLVACLATWFITATSRTSAASCSARSPGHDSSLRHRATLASCASGGHAIWWTVDAATEAAALELLPFFVAERSTATQVSDVDIP